MVKENENGRQSKTDEKNDWENSEKIREEKKDMNERIALNPPRELQSESHNDWPVTY